MHNTKNKFKLFSNSIKDFLASSKINSPTAKKITAAYNPSHNAQKENQILSYPPCNPWSDSENSAELNQNVEDILPTTS